MRRSTLRIIIVIVSATIAVMAPAHMAAAGVVLITPEEAQLPTPKGVFASRAITRGPHIDLANVDADKMQSLTRLQFKFRGFGGASVDFKTFRMTYLKSPSVDLTPRVMAYVQPTGIDIPDAEIPPGDHLVRIEIQDSEGRRTTTTFLFHVLP